MQRANHQWTRRVVGALALMTVVAVGCRGTERQSTTSSRSIITRRPADIVPSPSEERYYNPPPIEKTEPAPTTIPEVVPPAPVQPADPVGETVSFRLENRARGTRKPSSSEQSNAPRLLAPERARSLIDFMATKERRELIR